MDYGKYTILIEAIMYTSEDVEMLVREKSTVLSTYALSEEYLHVIMNDDYGAIGILLSKENAELLRDKLDVFLEGGYVHE